MHINFEKHCAVLHGPLLLLGAFVYFKVLHRALLRSPEMCSKLQNQADKIHWKTRLGYSYIHTHMYTQTHACRHVHLAEAWGEEREGGKGRNRGRKVDHVRECFENK